MLAFVSGCVLSFIMGYTLDDIVKEVKMNNEDRKTRNKDENTIQKKHKK